MFKNLLAQTDTLVGCDPRSLSSESWQKAVASLTDLLSGRMALLQAFAEAALGSKVFCGETFRYFYSREAKGPVSQGRICPPGHGDEASQGEFYPLPPLQLSVYLQAAYRHKDGAEHPSLIALQCEVRGERERDQAKDLFEDYRQHFRLLVNSVPLQFGSSACCDQVDRCRSKDPAKKLDLYFKEDDPENSFWFEAAFARSSDERTVARSFLILAALYDSIQQCLKERGNRDMIVRYADFLHG